jgi:hypothetical protein
LPRRRRRAATGSRWTERAAKWERELQLPPAIPFPVTPDVAATIKGGVESLRGRGAPRAQTWMALVLI